MNIITKFASFSAFVLSSIVPISSFAQAATDPSKMAMSQVSPAMTDGEIKKVDPDTGKVTIKHGDIKHLDMPGMTMVFTAKDKSLLTNIKSGDKVKFMVVNEGGKLIVTDLQPAR